jgi:hypothetical protein
MRTGIPIWSAVEVMGMAPMTSLLSRAEAVFSGAWREMTCLLHGDLLERTAPRIIPPLLLLLRLPRPRAVLPALMLIWGTQRSSESSPEARTLGLVSKALKLMKISRWPWTTTTSESVARRTSRMCPMGRKISSLISMMMRVLVSSGIRRPWLELWWTEQGATPEARR